MKKLQIGFTLTELMITLAIIGILSAIAIPFYQDHIARTQMAEALSLLGGQKSLMTEIFATSNKCPSNQKRPENPELVVNIGSKPEDYAGKYVKEIRIGTTPNGGMGSRCSAYAVFKDSGVSAALKGQWIALVFETGYVKDNAYTPGQNSKKGKGSVAFFECFVSTKMLYDRALIRDCGDGSFVSINLINE